MAVASQLSGGNRGAAASGLAVCGGSDELRRRIGLALREGAPDYSPVPVATADELIGSAAAGSGIVVLSCDVEGPRGMATLRRLRRELRAVRIVAVSPTATGTGVRRALDAGADAVVFEPELEATLAVAVSAVASGQSVVPRRLRASVQRPAFSHRERQVLARVARGLTNAQIAEELFLSESTVKSHLSSAFTRFGVRSRREAAALFRELEQQSGAA